MLSRIGMFVAAASVALVACGAQPSPAAPPPTPPAATAQRGDGPGGLYVREDPASGHMAIIPEGGKWRIEIDAGSPPNGAATAADCQQVAVGPLVNGTIVALRVPFDSADYYVSRDDAKQPDAGSTTVKITPDSATITESTIGGCGLAADVTGVYTKIFKYPEK